MSTRLYLLSKRLGIPNKQLIELLRSRGFDVVSASSSVADIYVEDLLREFGVSGEENAGGEAGEPVRSEESQELEEEMPDPVHREIFNETPQIFGNVAPVESVENDRPMVGRASELPAETTPDVTTGSRDDVVTENVRDGWERTRSATSAGGSTTFISERNEQRQQFPQRERKPMPQLLKPRVEEVSTQERPRMIPLERLQSAIRAQNNRVNGRGFDRDRRNPVGSFSGNRSGGQDRRGGNFGGDGFAGHGGRSGKNTAQQQGAQRDNHGVSRGMGRLPNQSQGTQELRQGDFRAPARVARTDPKVPAPVVFRTRAAPNIPGTSTSRAPQGSIPEIQGGELCLKFPISVREFAPSIGLKPFQLISELMQIGIFASMNYLLDRQLAQKIADKFQIVLVAQQEVVAPLPQIRPQKKKAVAPDAILEDRAPIVCVLGHVDHGKTTLLDTVRRTNVVAGEAGGITQHIGAYAVERDGKKVTFIDTPGHAAFSCMRERGANLTDVAVLVVAADDGFMPQTDEALKFAQKAGVPVVVAINKIDSKGANVERVKQQMQQRGIMPEEWGGETLCCGISALNGEGINGLLELILVQAEMLALQADYRAPVQGIVLESQVEVGRGPTASAIIQEGTLKVGDVLVCGSEYCKVRALVNDCGKNVKEAPPSMPVKIVGWSGPLEAGATFSWAPNEKVARAKAEEYAIEEEGVGEITAPRERGRRRSSSQENLDALFAAINAKQKKSLRVILRGDVQGSVEALAACLNALPQDKIGLEILRKEVGLVSKDDVDFASTTDATIVAFHTKAENGVQALLKRHSICMLQHDVIYMLIEQVRDAMADLLEPELQEEKLGLAQVRQIFTLSKGIIAGCMVTEGKILRDALARLHRDGQTIATGKISSLRRAKEDVQDVRAGFECGISLSSCDVYKIGDAIECYKINKIRPNL
ncbi:MAG: translation initiation factor IF-2 [Puniceicoccales bacterium]|jgi:translation initiation factor IF-2|nr:translation initiation factor IF-2 [Puniceicoccales bacterium]